MPKVATDPEKLRPYLFHGVDLNWSDSDKEATGTCPWCGREGKFSVNIETGQWRCFVCQESGNTYIFLRKLWEDSDKSTSNYKDLATDRRLLNSDTLIHWGACVSTITGEWLLPGYCQEGKLQQLYKYFQSGGRYLLMPTSTLGHKMFGVNLFDHRKEEIYICEGPWDGMSLWEHLASHKLNEEGALATTANQDKSLLAKANVVAVPTCTTFQEEWHTLFTDKVVHLMFDNDHPRKHPVTNKQVPAAGLTGMKRIAGILSGSKHPPKSINFLCWHPQHHYDPNLPSGYDVRDALTSTKLPTY